MLAGARAYRYIKEALIRAHKAAELLSAPLLEVDTETERALLSKADLQYKLSAAGRKMASLIASSLESTEGNAVVYLPLLDMDSLREFVNEASKKVSGALVALCGEEGELKYVISYCGEDFSSFIKNANAALGGKGGGRAPMAQGSYSSSLSDIEKYFS
jgi:alanyl-tRNA synthetase